MNSPSFKPGVRNCSRIKCEFLVWETHELSGIKRRVCGHNGRIPGNMTSCPRGKKLTVGVDHTQLKPGQRVRYHSMAGNEGEICTVCSDPWQLGHGDWVVSLKERSGGVGVDFISEIVQEA